MDKSLCWRTAEGLAHHKIKREVVFWRKHRSIKPCQDLSLYEGARDHLDSIITLMVGDVAACMVCVKRHDSLSTLRALISYYLKTTETHVEIVGMYLLASLRLFLSMLGYLVLQGGNTEQWWLEGGRVEGRRMLRF